MVMMDPPPDPTAPPPSPSERPRTGDAAVDLAITTLHATILDALPPSRARSLALTDLDGATLWLRTATEGRDR